MYPVHMDVRLLMRRFQFLKLPNELTDTSMDKLLES